MLRTEAMKAVQIALLLCTVTGCSAGDPDPVAEPQINESGSQAIAAGSATSGGAGPLTGPEPDIPDAETSGVVQNRSATSVAGRPPEANLETKGPQDTMPPPRVPSD